MDRLTEMEAFTTVVDEGGFTGAARKLGVSKSAVSKHVASLEARLGAKLLMRTTRRVNPTEIGLYYYDRARQVLLAASEADQSIETLQAVPSGFLRVAVTTEFGNAVVSRLLGRFLTSFPDISADLVLTDQFVELVSEGYDVALRIARQPDQTPRTVKICDVAFRLVASPDYIAARGRPERIEDLGGHETLQSRQSVAAANWTLVSPTGEQRTIHTRGRLAVNDGSALADAARSGLGIAFLPSFLVDEHIRDGALVPLMDSLPPQMQAVHAILPPAPLTPPKVQALIDFLLNECRSGIAAAASARG